MYAGCQKGVSPTSQELLRILSLDFQDSLRGALKKVPFLSKGSMFLLLALLLRRILDLPKNTMCMLLLLLILLVLLLQLLPQPLVNMTLPLAAVTETATTSNCSCF